MATENMKQRRFAGTRRTNDRQELAACYVQIDTAQRWNLDLPDVINFLEAAYANDLFRTAAACAVRVGHCVTHRRALQSHLGVQLSDPDKRHRAVLPPVR